MTGIALSIPLILSLLKIQTILTTSCYFSRPNCSSSTGWVDLIDECKENRTDAICFSGVIISPKFRAKI